MKKYVVLGLVIGCFIGFFIGRVKTVEKEVVRYVKGETKTDTIFIHTPVKEVLTTDTLYLVERDTVKTLYDFNLHRTYKETINNEYGKIDFTAGVQYNKLQNFTYSQTPIIKEVVRTIYPTWQPFAGLNYNTFNEVSLSVGTFYHNVGLEASYMRDFNQNQGFGIGIKYKF